MHFSKEALLQMREQDISELAAASDSEDKAIALEEATEESKRPQDHGIVVRSYS